MAEREGMAMPIHPPPAERLQLRLYIAAGAPNSVRALANLEVIRREYLGTGCQVEVIDIFQEPLRALNDGILLTPTLVRLAPLPAVKIVGDLSDRARVLQTLGVLEQAR